MSIRSELEDKLISFASSQSTPIPVSVEGKPFRKPATGPYLQCYLLSSQTSNATVDAYRQRTYGAFQINVCSPDGVGSKALEALTEQVAALYPVVPKELFTELSIEQPPQTSQAMIDGAFRYIAITVRYRHESSY